MAGFPITHFSNKRLHGERSGQGTWYARDALDADIKDGRLVPLRTNRLVDYRPGLSAQAFIVEDCCIKTFWDCGGNVVRVRLPTERTFKLNYPGELLEADNLCDDEWNVIGHPALSKPTLTFYGTSITEYKAIRRQYIYAVVNKYGEIEAVSTPSDIVMADWDNVCYIGGIDNVQSENLTKIVNKWIHIYSTAPDQSLTQNASPSDLNFFFVGRMKYGQTTYRHEPTSDGYREALLPDLYEAPPKGMRHLAYWGEKQLAALWENRLVFSQIGNFSSWPSEYHMQFYHDPISFVAGNRWGYILTCGNPEVIDLTTDCKDGRCHSAVMIQDSLPIIGPRSAAVYNDGVIYASTKGLIYLKGTQWELLTSALTDKEYAALEPQSINAIVHDGSYFFMSHAGAFRLRLPDNPGAAIKRADLSRLSLLAPYSWYVSDNGRLFWSSQDNRIYEWNAGGQRLQMEWASDAFPPRSKIKYIYVDGEPGHDVQASVIGYNGDTSEIALGAISGSGWVRMPGWTRDKWWSFKIKSTGMVRGMYLSSSKMLRPGALQ